MKLLVPPLNVSHENGFTPEVDIFNRKFFGESLFDLVRNTEDELVLALDAPWGEGKSTFIKMWKGLLTKNDTPCIYFDAFENDYQSEPFLAISSQIYQLIDDDDEISHREFKEKATSALKVVGRAGLRVGIKALTAGILDETVLDETGNLKDTSKEASDLVDSFVSSQLTKAGEDRKNLKAFKIHLASLGKKLGGENPVVFIIDELDRCKPKFALSLIESIKHLFSVPNITFVLVMNRKQLEEAVRCEYGSGVDATRYLQKFVSIWTTLPKPKDHYSSISKTYLKNCLNSMGYQIQTSTHESTIECFEEIASFYDLSLREIERSLTNFAIIHNATNGKLNDDYSSLSVLISILKAIKPDVYKKLLSRSINYDQLLIEASLNELNVSWWEDKPEGHPLKWILKYYLGTDDEVEELLKQGNYLNGRSGYNRDAVTSICAWLETFRRD
jgi:predicted KAP-like P-loop ATPase